MRRTSRLAIKASIAIPLLIATSCATGPDNNQNSLRPKGEQAQKIMDLYSPIFWIATTIGIGVVLATIYVSIRYRSTKKNSSPKQIHGNSVLEIGWTILPLVILIGVAIPTVKTVFEIKKPAKADAVQIKVTGKQWWWQFAVKTDSYELKNADGTVKTNPETGATIFANTVVTANEIVVPANRDIELDIGACDSETPVLNKTTDELKKANPCNVIHSFWIPSLGGKADAVPGRTNKLVLKTGDKGIFTGQCAEYCGLSHGVMRMQVRVVSEAEYEKWIANLQKPPVTSAIAKEGEKPTAAQVAFAKFSCANCHATEDPSQVTYGPNLTHFGADYENEVMGGGSIPKKGDHVWQWIYNATDWRNGWGIPMQSDDCRISSTLGEGDRCVGMPNFSVAYESVDENGKKVTLPAMTTTEAKAIALYLENNK